MVTCVTVHVRLFCSARTNLEENEAVAPPRKKKKALCCKKCKNPMKCHPRGQCPTYITFKNSNLTGFYIEHSCHSKQLYIVFFIKRQVLFFIFTTAWWVFLLFRRVLHLLFNNVSLHLHQHPLFV